MGVTLVWLALLAVLAWWIFGLAVEGWADQHTSGDVHRPDFTNDVALSTFGFLIALLAGPIAITVAVCATRPSRRRSTSMTNPRSAAQSKIDKAV